MVWRNWLHFSARLERRGFHQLGRGEYSRVFHKPGSNRVIKVCKGLDGWSDYVLWAAEHGYAGNHAPLVHSLHIMPDQTGKLFCVAVMERLECVVCALPMNSPPYQLKAKISSNAMSFTAEPPDEWRGFAAAFKQRFPQGGGRCHDMHDGNWMLRTDGSLVLIDPIVDNGACSPPSRYRSYGARSLRLAA